MNINLPYGHFPPPKNFSLLFLLLFLTNFLILFRRTNVQVWRDVRNFVMNHLQTYTSILVLAPMDLNTPLHSSARDDTITKRSGTVH